MGFREGTINTAVPTTDLLAQIEAEFALHDNWDFVEELVIGAETYRVWKCRGSGLGANAFGLDFYISLVRDSVGTGTLRVKAFEGWDAATKLATRYCAGNTTAIVPAADGSVGAVGLTLGSASLVQVGIPMTASIANDYVIQVSKDRVVCGVRQGTIDGGWYAGLFESLMPAEPFPLVLVGDGTNDSITGTSACSWSRHPTVTTGRSNNFLANVATWSQVGGTATQPDRFFGSDASASRVLVRAAGAAPDLDGFVRGLLRGCMWLPDGSTALRTGSTSTVGAEIYSRVRCSGSVWVRRIEA